MKKLLACLLAVIMILSSIGTMVSCDNGSGSGDEKHTEDKNSERPNVEQTTDAPVTPSESDIGNVTDDETPTNEETTVEETASEETVTEETVTDAPHVCDFSQWVTTDQYLASAATCTDPAYYYYSCTCGEKGESVFSWGQANGHGEYVMIEGVEANCTETGLSEGYKCGICGEITTEQQTIPVNAKHDYENGACIRCGLTEPSSGLEFQSQGGYYYVTGIGTCTDREIVIPSEYNGLPVIAISNMAFANNMSIVKVTLPETLTVIHERAFTGCENLVEVYNRSSIEIAVGDAWNSNGCVAQYAKNVYTQDSGESILVHQGDFIFCPYGDEYRLMAYTGSDEEISLPADGISEYSVGFWAFAWNKNLKSVVIPDNVTVIYGSAFYYCENLENITIGSSVRGIDSFAFAYSGLKEVVIPANVRTVGDYAFLQIRNLESVTLEDGIESIGQSVFTSCSSLKSLSIPSSVKYLGSSLVQGCTSLESFSIDEECEAAMYGITFADCTSLKKVALNNATEEIANEMFRYCTSLEEVRLGSNVRLIGDSAFAACSSLKSVTIPESVTEIGDSAFYGCSALESVTIGENVKKIGSMAFANCSSLLSISIPDSVEEIGNQMFQFCTSLEEVKLGNGVTAIYEYTFSGCISLKAVDLGNSITTIGSNAFLGCSSLTEIVIPNSVTNMSNDIFAGCTSLKSVTIPFINSSLNDPYGYEYPLGYFFGTVEYEGTVKTSQKMYYSGGSQIKEYFIPTSLEKVVVTGTFISQGAFTNCTTLKEITLAEGLTSIPQQAFSYASSLESINIPSTVTSIGYNAFYSCTELKKIEISSVEAWCGITFENYYANPLYKYTQAGTETLGCALCIDGEELTRIIIPEGVTEIKPFAFAGCTTVDVIHIPSTVRTIGDGAFKDALIKNVSLESLSSYITVSIANEAASPFYMGAELYDLSLDAPITEISIPAGATAISAYAFAGCGAKSVSIPASVTVIGASAFKNCGNINSVYLEDLTAWFYVTFEDDYSNPIENGADVHLAGDLLTELTVPAGVTTVKRGAFKNCTSLTKVTIPEHVISVEFVAFANCPNLNNVDLSSTSSNASIAYDAFSGCKGVECFYGPADSISGIDKTSLKEIVITSGTNIPTQTFYGCTKLEKVTLTEGLTYIGKQAFASTGITEIIIPDSVIYIAEDAFEDCYRLAHVTLGTNLQSIGNGAFAGTMTLVEICNRSSIEIVACDSNSPDVSANGYIGEGVRRIYTEGSSNLIKHEGFIFFYDAEKDIYYLVNDETQCEEVVLPESVNDRSYEILARAFYIRHDLKSVTLSNGVTKIGDSAFMRCTNLEYMNTPDSLVYIAWNALTECDKLYEIVDGIYYIDKWVAPYGYDKSITEAVVREGTVGLAYNAFYHYQGNSIRSFSFPTTLKYICGDTFQGCSPSSLYINDLAAWVSVWREPGYYTNVMAYSASLGNLYVNGDLVTDIVIPEGVTEISGRSFLHFNITSVKLPTTLTKIGHEAFYNCTALTNIEFNSAVEEIEYRAFEGCTNLTQITLPEGLQKIGSSAFQGCSKLTSIDIPSTVTSIESWAFWRSGITTIRYNGTADQWKAIEKTDDDYLGIAVVYLK